MTIKSELADGRFEIFESDNFMISKPKDFHPLILKITVYSNGRRIKTVRRPLKFFYRHFTFKSEKVQKQLEEIRNQQMMNQIRENSTEVKE